MSVNGQGCDPNSDLGSPLRDRSSCFHGASGLFSPEDRGRSLVPRFSTQRTWRESLFAHVEVGLFVTQRNRRNVAGKDENSWPQCTYKPLSDLLCSTPALGHSLLLKLELCERAKHDDTDISRPGGDVGAFGPTPKQNR